MPNKKITTQILLERTKYHTYCCRLRAGYVRVASYVCSLVSVVPRLSTRTPGVLFVPLRTCILCVSAERRTVKAWSRERGKQPRSQGFFLFVTREKGKSPGNEVERKILVVQYRWCLILSCYIYSYWHKTKYSRYPDDKISVCYDYGGQWHQRKKCRSVTVSSASSTYRFSLTVPWYLTQ